MYMYMHMHIYGTSYSLYYILYCRFCVTFVMLHGVVLRCIISFCTILNYLRCSWLYQPQSPNANNTRNNTFRPSLKPAEFFLLRGFG